MTDAEFHAWLKDPSRIPVVLVEVAVRVSGVETTRYLATRGYTTKGTDTPANTVYLPIVAAEPKFREELSLEGQDASISAGDLEIHNMNGERDSWLLDVWDNRQIQAFIGDARWARSDFRMVFNGLVASLGSRARGTINLKITDKLQRLNTPLSETKLGGTTPNKDNLLPLLFGEGHNISPLLTDPTTLEYQVHDVAVESIFEVRDNGMPVGFAATAGTGKFTLTQDAFGTLTVSAQGDKGDGTYRNTVAALVRRLVTSYGKASDRFVTGDLDTANLDAFDAANTQPVGTWLPDRTNVLAACSSLASSTGAQLAMSRLGQLRLLRVTLPAAGTPTVVRESQMMERSLRIAARPPVVAAVKLGFNKNWTVQDGLLTTIPAQHKDLFAKEWLEAVASDSTVQANYKLNTEPVLQETMLLARADAQVEAQRRLDLWKVQRTVYEFEGTADLLDTLELGGAITIFNRRFNLSAGATGMVISLAPQWATGRVTVGVLV